MTSKDFIHWFKGFLDLENPTVINQEQVKIIQNHLKLVFYHEIDPSYTSDLNKQKEMQNIHDGKKEVTKKPLWEPGMRC